MPFNIVGVARILLTLRTLSEPSLRITFFASNDLQNRLSQVNVKQDWNLGMTPAEEVQDRIKMSDGFGLFYRCWKTAGDVQRVVVCVHGLGMNSEFFGNLGQALTEDGIEVYALDLRGFGNSVEIGLERGDTSNFKGHLQDLNEAVAFIHQKYPEKHVFMLGHSLGCCYALWYAANHPDSLNGLVLAAPPIQYAKKASKILVIKGLLFLLFAPKKKLYANQTMPESLRKSEEYKLLNENPLNAHGQSARYIIRVVGPLQNGALKNASRTRTPTLIIQGEADTHVLPKGAKKLLECLATEDKTLKSFADADHRFYHLIFTKSKFQDDPAKRKQVTDAVSDWIKNH
jgi:alpha-beta hydrolase superfamily lysophospholipase